MCLEKLTWKIERTDVEREGGWSSPSVGASEVVWRAQKRSSLNQRRPEGALGVVEVELRYVVVFGEQAFGDGARHQLNPLGFGWDFGDGHCLGN